MLYLLSGDIQIGKTRWLLRMIETLADSNITCYGVIAPGRWERSSGPDADSNGFAKSGIDNVLLPENRKIAFADRKDIAEQNGTYDRESQAGKARLGWHIHDDALLEVNEHLRSIPSKCASGHKGLLVIDEVGRLELEHGNGLTEAISLLEHGPCDCFDSALVVARRTLADEVENRFSSIWGGCKVISPDKRSESLLLKELVRP